MKVIECVVVKVCEYVFVNIWAFDFLQKSIMNLPIAFSNPMKYIIIFYVSISLKHHSFLSPAQINSLPPPMKPLPVSDVSPSHLLLLSLSLSVYPHLSFFPLHFSYLPLPPPSSSPGVYSAGRDSFPREMINKVHTW